MWDDTKRQRFAELRGQEEAGSLSQTERTELAALTGELLELESAYLDPATRRLRQQWESVEAQNRRLAELAARRANLVQRLESMS